MVCPNSVHSLVRSLTLGLVPNYLRIGALSSLTGVSPDTLRAWERRYAVFAPSRTSGRFRLYGDEDVARVREMARLIDSGVAASEAAQRVLDQGARSEAEAAHVPLFVHATQELHDAFRSFDAAAIESAIDHVLSTADLDSAIRDVFIPALVEIGNEWATGHVSVAQEHFSVGVLRGRLLGLARGWDMGFGPRALLACPPHEEHDVSLVMFGLALHRRGWRITFLGANTPIEDLLDTQRRLEPRLTVLFSARWDEHEALVPAIANAARMPLALAGANAQGIAERAGCRHLNGDLISVADDLSRSAT